MSRNGDLIHRVYLRVELPDVVVPGSNGVTGAGTAFRWLNWVGHIFVKTVEIEIGGQRIKTCQCGKVPSFHEYLCNMEEKSFGGHNSRSRSLARASDSELQPHSS